MEITYEIRQAKNGLYTVFMFDEYGDVVSAATCETPGECYKEIRSCGLVIPDHERG